MHYNLKLKMKCHNDMKVRSPNTIACCTNERRCFSMETKQP